MMEMKFSGDRIEFNKVLSDLDNLVLKFVDILEKEKIKYVIISGYVPILFGRSRATEDVDLFVERLDLTRFMKLAESIKSSGFYCLNETDDRESYRMLCDKLALRFAEENKVIPNFEMKFPSKHLDDICLIKPLKVVLNGNKLNISPIELEIPYKIYLGSEKDIEDAVYLYEIFKDKINHGKTMDYAAKIGVLSRMAYYGIKLA